VTAPHLPFIRSLFQQYDTLALRHFGNVRPEAKADGSAVTRLDREASATIVAALKDYTPDFGIVSEEEATAYRSDAEWKWVIDPVDGTASFARGYAVWGLGIGLMHEDRPVEGYMRFPVLGETFLFADGQGMHNGQPMSVAPPFSISDTHNVLTSSTLHAEIPYQKLAHFKLRSLGSTLYQLGCLAMGRADAMICPASYLWDLAAGLPFTRAAGLVERGIDGAPFRLEEVAHSPEYRMSAPILIGRPAEVEALASALRG
jgi:fructose-1,6-bisphosphatase/inositol monophosphatase family enzyme